MQQDEQVQTQTNSGYGPRRIPDADLPTEYVEGILDIAHEGSGLLRPKILRLVLMTFIFQAHRLEDLIYVLETKWEVRQGDQKRMKDTGGF